MTAPAVKIEIAFNAGYSTAPGSRTWTDVTSKVDANSLISITNGRTDEMGQADANRLSLTLDNSDGRFTPTNPSSPYYPNVRIGRPIRITSTPAGGSASVRFLGFVDEWPVSWEVTDNYAISSITASSQLAFLGMGSEMSNVIAETILYEGASAYYPLNEPEGATSASDVLGGARLVPSSSQLAGGITFGGATGPATDSQKSVQFNALYFQYLTARVLVGDIGGLSFWFSTTTPTQSILNWGPLSIEMVGGVVYINGGGSLIGSSNLADGLVHNITIMWDDSGPAASLYVDGVSDAVGMVFLFGTTAVRQLNVGENFTGGLSHLAIFPNFYAYASSIWDAGHDGFAGEQAPYRFGRIASWVDADYTTTGLIGEQMDHFDTSGKTVVDAMRVVAEADNGVVFDGPDGVTVYQSRYSRYAVASAFSVDVYAAEVDAGLEPRFDRSVMVNDVTATAGDGSTARVTNEPSRAEYGTVRGTAEIAASVEHARNVAAWRVQQYGEPKPRIGSLGIRIESWSTAKQAQVFSAGVGSKISLTNLPAQAPPMSSGVFIEGWTETIGLNSHAFSFNVSPGELGDVIILDDAVRCLDSAYTIAL